MAAGLEFAAGAKNRSRLYGSTGNLCQPSIRRRSRAVQLVCQGRVVAGAQAKRRNHGWLYQMGRWNVWEDGTYRFGDYYELMAEVIASSDRELLHKFILTVGVVSNHGNWFTAENHSSKNSCPGT
jgi:hypothetical protein